jgi:ubiquinone biosynthesis protein Coq4
MAATITPAFSEKLLATFNDLGANPVHMLFNQFWKDVPEEVATAYLETMQRDPRFTPFVTEGYYAEPISLERLAECPQGSRGEAYRTFIVDNDLQEKIATDDRMFHDVMRDSGMLDGMPDELQFAILRGYQVHDFIHTVTGYRPDPRGEVAVQAFCLAQIQFPYFAMWISVVTTRSAFIDPTHTVGLMDAIAEGWQFGRTVENLQYERWEDQIDDPIADVRARYGIAPDGLGPLRS